MNSVKELDSDVQREEEGDFDFDLALELFDFAPDEETTVLFSSALAAGEYDRLLSPAVKLSHGSDMLQIFSCRFRSTVLFKQEDNQSEVQKQDQQIHSIEGIQEGNDSERSHPCVWTDA